MPKTASDPAIGDDVQLAASPLRFSMERILSHDDLADDNSKGKDINTASTIKCVSLHSKSHHSSRPLSKLAKQKLFSKLIKN